MFNHLQFYMPLFRLILMKDSSLHFHIKRVILGLRENPLATLDL